MYIMHLGFLLQVAIALTLTECYTDYQVWWF